MMLVQRGHPLQLGTSSSVLQLWSIVVLVCMWRPANALLVPNGPITNRTECGGGNGPIWADMFCTFPGVAIQYGDVAQYTLVMPSDSLFNRRQFDLTIQLRPDDLSNVDL